MDVKALLAGKGRDIASVKAESTLSEAAHLLSDKHIGALVVLDDTGALSGILSERDIVRAIAQAGASALTQTVSAYMTRKVVTCSEHDSVQTLMERMTAGKFRHLPVVTSGKLIGIISIGDVVKYRVAQMESESADLRNYIMSA
jgi:CBS domain-containing protein